MRKLVISLLACSAICSTTASAQMSNDTVRIGVLTDYTGMFAGLSGPGGEIAARMAVDDFGGKVGGVPIELMSADHQNKADLGSALVRRWYDEDGVDLVVDVPNSSVALAVQAIANERKKLVIYAGAGTADLTGKACMPTGFQWVWDTYSVAVSTGRALLDEGLKNWYVLAADYAFGQTMTTDITKIVEANGGKIVGTTKHPINTPDLSSFILQAQGASPDVIALANGGADMINTIKQFAEFGGASSGIKLAGLAVFISDIHGVGLESAQGMVLTTGFYWDRTDETREWSKRFFGKHGAMPTMAQAGVYSAVTHYLHAVEALKDDDPVKVAEQMRKTPVNDIFVENGSIREDGRMLHDMYLVEVKKPEDVRYPWDYYTILRTIPAADTVRPLAESACPLAKK
ncbi:ABC transporter substrate-binding protein [Rhizobium laguerreae]|uniref:ABC transporter substrate-binding protein n=1 Tax=Rhizobium laguerreae TaxID=1076926 RepID=UPI001C903EB2|nr:ABC transporter substrate-binding protein [Rhizobium laguerreae]MBY3422503.1 ABC transporter substrate-binding protein [Rhizobium laguerreae]MBY3569068.1 ABC transporter substrate-binding protein [Rhizobium laguerreae]